MECGTFFLPKTHVIHCAAVPESASGGCNGRPWNQMERLGLVRPFADGLSSLKSIETIRTNDFDYE